MPGFIRKMFGQVAQDPQGADVVRLPLAGQHQTDVGLQQSEERFSELVAGVRDYAVFLLDAQGNVATWNAGAERIKGYRAEEIIGQHFSRFYPSDAVTAGWPAHELNVASQTGRFEDEGWRVRNDGSRFWANVVITAIRGPEGEVRGFLKITRDLTDRKQSEEKLRLSEERFRLLVEGIKDYAIFMLDPEGRVATWNSGAERLKGYLADEIIGQHFSRFYPQDAVERGWPGHELKVAIQTGRFEDEGWRVRKDGSTFWANVIITALRDESGSLRGFAKVTRDLTARRQAEEDARRVLEEETARKAAEEAAREIERQREQLRVTLTSIGDAVIVTDMNSLVTFMNPVAINLTGWQPEDAAGKPLEQVFRIINEQSRQPVENPVRRVLREGIVVGLANHTVLVARDGREIPIDDSGAPIRGEQGTIAGAVLVFRDVTEARRAMEDRLRLAAIVESSDDAIISNSLEGVITSWNKSAERLYGYAAAEIIGKPLNVLVPPEHADELPAILARIRRGERIEHLETQRIRKDGSRLDVSLTVSPIIAGDGRIAGASKIARDITSRKEEERRRTEFLAMLAHELRNPLAPIRNGVEVIRLAAGEPAIIEQATTVMERQVQHLVRLVDDLLDVSRISRGKLQLRLERLELAAVVRSALEVCGQTVELQGHDLNVTFPDQPLYVDVDKTRLAQTVCNLLNNAVKYSERGTRIDLAVKRSDDEAVISVKDAGVGIPPEMLPQIFEMFAQVDRSLEKSQGGLGVGLTIVKRLIEMHGGSVEARSAGYGTGSEFIVRLPLAPAMALDESPDAAEQPPHHPRPHRILVVDDNVDAASSLAIMLQMMGHEVHTAHDGLAAIEVADSIRPHLILLDIGMPRLDGYETCRRLRSHDGGRAASIVALTGWGQDEDKRRSAAAGFDGHLIKPAEPTALARLLAGLESTHS